jgi:hypothetical protein
MNHSMSTCGWTTHVKIVVVALTAAALVATSTATAKAKAGGPVLKAGKPALYSTRGDDAVR